MSDWISRYSTARSRAAFALVSSQSGPGPLYCAPIMQWRNWTKRVRWRGPYFRSDEVLRVRSTDALIVHDFEAELLALFQAVHFCAFDSTYIDQHINAAAVGLDKTVTLMDIERSYGSRNHSASAYGYTIADPGGRALISSMAVFADFDASPRPSHPMTERCSRAELEGVCSANVARTRAARRRNALPRYRRGRAS